MIHIVGHIFLLSWQKLLLQNIFLFLLSITFFMYIHYDISYKWSHNIYIWLQAIVITCILTMHTSDIRYTSVYNLEKGPGFSFVLQTKHACRRFVFYLRARWLYASCNILYMSDDNYGVCIMLLVQYYRILPFPDIVWKTKEYDISP